MGSSRPKISVIIPVHNAELYLCQCLDSLQAQSLRDFEIICVDDGSTDQSALLLEKYRSTDSRLMVLTQDNLNAGVARNNAMRHAKGEYLVFLDADDFFEPGLLERQYSCIKSNDADVCFCTGDRYHNSDCNFQSAPWYLKTQYLPDKKVFSKEDCRDYLFQISNPAPWTKIFKHEHIKKWNLRFQNLPRSNDVYFVYGAIALADRIAAVNEVLIHYRIGMDTNLQANNAKDPLAFCKALAALKQLLNEKNMYGTLEQSFANMALSMFIYNIESLKSQEMRNMVLHAFCKKWFRAFSIENKQKEYFYNAKFYDKYQELRTDYESSPHGSKWHSSAGIIKRLFMRD